MRLSSAIALGAVVLLASSCESPGNNPDEQQLARINKELALVGEQVTALADRVERLEARRVTDKDSPASPDTPDTPPAPTLAVTVDASGALSFDGKPIERAALATLLRDSATRNADTGLTIHATSAVPHAVVVSVLELARNSGIVRLAIDPR